MENEITKHITPSGLECIIKGPIIKHSYTLQRYIPYEGYYHACLKIPHSHVVARGISNHTRIFIKKQAELEHICYYPKTCSVCTEICRSIGDCGDSKHHLVSEYNRLVFDYFDIGVAEEMDGYDEIWTDTNHSGDLHVKISDDPPPELIRDSIESTKTDSFKVETVKTKKYVIDCLNQTAEHIDKIQREYDEFWQDFVIKLVFLWKESLSIEELHNTN